MGRRRQIQESAGRERRGVGEQRTVRVWAGDGTGRVTRVAASRGRRWSRRRREGSSAQGQARDPSRRRRKCEKEVHTDSESATEESAGEEARLSGGSGRALRAVAGGAVSSGEEKVRAGPEEAGRRRVGRKPGTTGRVQHDPPGRGGGGKGDDGCWWTGRRGQRGGRGRPEARAAGEPGARGGWNSWRGVVRARSAGDGRAVRPGRRAGEV